MADDRLRRLEREAKQGDPAAEARLARERQRVRPARKSPSDAALARARRVNAAVRQIAKREDRWAAATAFENAAHEALQLLERHERGQRTTWAKAGDAESCRELAQRLSDLIHREGEYAR